MRCFERRNISLPIMIVALLMILPAPLLYAQTSGSLAEKAFELPTWSELWRVISLRDYNTRVVVIGTMLLGIAAGLVGTFLLLRKRALLSDAVAHATLPGVALGFMVMASFGGSGKYLPGLLLGAAVLGTLGMISVLAIRRLSRLKDDAALGIVLSVYFGLGVALIGIVTRMETGNAAGLNSFIYGKTASMLFSDAVLIGAVAVLAAVICALMFKEFALLCFDQDFASVQGWPVTWLDLLMMTLVVIVTVIGLQAVGLILLVALLIIPPAGARFWTHDLRYMTVISAALGGLSGLLGSGISALMENLPAGAVIVLVAAFFFFVSLLLGTERGLIKRWLEHLRLTQKVNRQHLLREMFEVAERRGFAKEPAAATFTIDDLLKHRAWVRHTLDSVLSRAKRHGLVQQTSPAEYRLTESGAREAQQVSRNHRLWEIFLITHADIAPSMVHRDADKIEHVLDEGMVKKLERLLEEEKLRERVPPSPHSLNRVEGAT